MFVGSAAEHQQHAQPLPAPTRLEQRPRQYTANQRNQGAQHRSPYDGRRISGVEGIVTALTGGGFYLQDPIPDEDERTSEAIFVSANAFGQVKVGDLVRVEEGIVREFNPAGPGANSLTRTELNQVSFTVLTNGRPLPEAVVLGEGGRRIPNMVSKRRDWICRQVGDFDPDRDGLDFYESLEGMRVQVNDALAVSSPLVQRGRVVADNGKNAGVLSPRGVLVLRHEDFQSDASYGRTVYQ
jgi:hypothetical protein